MRSFIRKFLPFFVAAAAFSFVINMLLLAPSLYMLQVYDRVLGSRSIETLIMLTIILGGALLVMSALDFVRSRLLIKANNSLDAMLAPYLLDKMIATANSPEGSPYAHGLKDLSSIKTFLTGNAIFSLFDAPWLPVYLIILWMMDPLLLWVASAGAVIMIILAVLNELATRNTLQDAGQSGRKAGNLVAAGMKNAEVVNAMGMQKGLARRWKELNTVTLDLQSRASRRAGMVAGSSKFVRQFLQSVMLGTGAWLVITTHDFSTGLMICGTIILGKALAPIEQMIGSWKAFLEARRAYARIDDFIKGLAREEQHMELPPPTGQLTFEHVSFGIRATKKVIVKDVNFSLAAGDSLGIIGPSAAGKSSLARLITGVWTPQAGTIRLDGSDIENWQKESLGQYLGYLPQDVELFAGTIAENIARLDVPDSEQVIAAAKLAGVHDMILQMTDGYDTQIGEGGAVLSGGQRQRIGLARALFGSPRLVVLDEPNASLDDAGEKALLLALGHLKSTGATTVVITHKMSILANVDKLLIMQEGTVAGFGPRDAVLAHLSKKQQEASAAAAKKNTNIAASAALEAPHA